MKERNEPQRLRIELRSEATNLPLEHVDLIISRGAELQRTIFELLRFGAATHGQRVYVRVKNAGGFIVDEVRR